MNDVALSRKAMQKGVSAMPLSSTYSRLNVRGGLVLGYGGANTHQIREGIRRLRTILEDAH
jgi:GntR family transcriptional regulator / MocR family aminotransferase